MQSNNNYQNDANLTGSFSAKLAIIASAVSTVGDILATVAAVQSYEETLIENQQQAQQQKEQDDKMQAMQATIDTLTLEIEKLKTSLSQDNQKQ